MKATQLFGCFGCELPELKMAIAGTGSVWRCCLGWVYSRGASFATSWFVIVKHRSQ